ncbi:SET domain-containing protein [Glonium stellatum]|uniref:SET domain-containing protein n=1 Tax=Glonium stellatum TaxID=574774 RepID=A0A8E2JPT2_9PEZI|nr:SET domain-containing protein [Glonium stellatum]
MVDDFQAKSDVFMAWLANSSATISNKIVLRDLREHDAGRGVVAISDIAEDELLFSIPRTSVLSVENSDLSTTLRETLQELDPWASLILVMLYEYMRGANSPWKPYFDVLPTEFNTLMFWAEDELAELQASAVRGKIGREGADNLFKEMMMPIIRENQGAFFPREIQANYALSDADLLALAHRMGSTIMAYAFDIEPVELNKEVDEEGYASEEEDEALPKGMVPLADMLNADADRNNARLFYESNVLTMKALKPIAAGEEIFNDYGPLPRSDLLRRYGYITANYAQYDVVEVSLEIVREAIQSESQIPSSVLPYLEDHGIVDSGYDISYQGRSGQNILEDISPELLILIEALLAPAAEFDRLKAKGKLPNVNELSSQGIKCLLNIIRNRAAQYSTSRKEDVDMLFQLAGVPIHAEIAPRKLRRVKMAVEVRIGEKLILEETEKVLEEMAERAGEGLLLKRNERSPQTSANKKRRTT